MDSGKHAVVEGELVQEGDCLSPPPLTINCLLMSIGGLHILQTRSAT
jgi:hypothetical protein